MAGTDFSHLTDEELLNGIKALNIPDYIRSKSYGIDVRETLAQMTEMLMQLAYNQGMNPQQAQDWVSQLNKKITKGQVTMSDLSQEIKEAFTGGAVAVVGEGAVREVNIVDSSVTNSKIADIELTGVNLFDKSKLVQNKLFDVYGEYSEYAGFDVFSFLPTATTYWIDSFHSFNGAIFQKNDGSFSAINGVPTGGSFEIPTGTVKVYLNITHSLITDNFMLNVGSKRNSVYLTSHDGTFKTTKVKGENLVGNVHLEDINNVEFLNLIDKSRLTPKTWVYNGKIETVDTVHLSHLIKVNEGETYSYSNKVLQIGGYFNANGEIIGNITQNDTTYSQFTVPKGVSFARINVLANNADNAVLVKGTTQPPMGLPYGFKIKGLAQDMPLDGVKVLTIGDSITWLDGQTIANVGTIIGYQSQLRLSGAIVTNQGNSGATYRKYVDGVSDIQHGSIYDDIVTDQFDVTPYDVITLFGGTNDVGRGWNKGTDDSTDPNTTIGSLRGIVDYIRANNPKAKIIILSPIQSSLASRPKNTMLEMTDVCKLISEEYSIKFVDMQRYGGIGKGNFDTLLYDGLHPNNDGMEIIGKRFVSASKDVLGA